MLKDTSRHILGVRVDKIDYASAVERITHWANRGESRMVCAANVHMIMEGHDNAAFRRRINQSDLTTPDGMPLVWALRWLGLGDATRVYGPTLMLALCDAAARMAIPVGLYGGQAMVLDDLVVNLRRRFPDLAIVYAHAPPFSPLTPDERKRQLRRIRQAGVRILFVALGCPKQENWIAAYRGRIDAVMLGVGAAFDYHSGHLAQAPVWMGNIGLEWLFRLATEPRRLWRRYCTHNPRFIGLLAKQLWERRWSKEIM